MAGERKFIREKMKRSLVKDFLRRKIEGAGFGGLDIQRTPMGTRINIVVERPGLVIGRGGSNVNKLTRELEQKFDLDNPQIEIEEVKNASLNAQIMAEKLAAALERGWHFRRAGHSTVRRIMESGAKGVQIIISGKITGARHRMEKFTQGHVKYCGETAREVMDEGYAEAKKKLGMLGVKVRIMKEDAKLPDEIHIKTTEKPKKTEKTTEAKKETDKDKEEKEAKKTEKKTEKPKKEAPQTDLKELPGVGDSLVEKFEKKGITSAEDLYDMTVDDLAAMKGIGKKTAKSIKKELEKLSKERS